MDERLKQFRFLSDEEFSVLPGAQKALYLSVATQALEQVQRKLKGQMRQFVSEPKSAAIQPNTTSGGEHIERVEGVKRASPDFNFSD